MSRRYDPRDHGVDYQSQGYPRQDPYPPSSYGAAPHQGPPPQQQHQQHQQHQQPPPPPPPPPQGPYYAPPAYHNNPHLPPPPPSAPHAYYRDAPLQWPDQPPPPPPHYHDLRRYPDPYAPHAPHPLDPALRGPPAHAGYQQPQPPAQLSHAFTAHAFPTNYGPRTRRRPKEQARAACSNCKRDHVSCDNTRPCRRCVSACKEATCEDVPPKKRGRPKVRADPELAQPTPQSTAAETDSERPPADQTEIPPKDEQDTPRAPTSSGNQARDSQARHPPSSWVPPRSRATPPAADHQAAAGASAPLSRSNSAAGPRPSPPGYPPLAPARVSPMQYRVDPRDTRSGAPVYGTPPGPSPTRSHPLGGLPPPRGGEYGPPYAVAGAPPPPGYHGAPPPPPLHNPPLPPRPGSSTMTQGPQLPPLSSLRANVPLSPERRSGDSAPVYDFSPATPRRLSDHAAPRSHRYSWHEPRSPAALSRRPSSQGGAAPRRRSIDAHSAPQSVAGQRRPSESDHAEGHRKRQRLTLNEIMRNDE